MSARGPGGDRERGPATIAQVAARAQVSTATVSRVMSGRSRGRRGTRERVLEAVAELDYRPSDIARSLKRQATRTLGLLVTDIQNPYFPQLVRAIEDRAHESGYALLLGNGTDDPEREAAYLASLAARRVDGLIIAASRLTRRHATALERLRAPTVLVNCESAEGGWPSAMSDNREGGRVAAEHLIGLGHRHLGLVTVQGEAAAHERRAGIDDAIRGAPRGTTLRAVTGATGAAAGEASVTRLLSRHPTVTGILCYNDALALGVLRGIRASGRAVPRDVSVVGFDDIELAAFAEPPLTTVRQDIRGLGRWAVERLLEDLRVPATAARSHPYRTLRRPVRLVVRATTSPPR
ncbi:MAG: LacI family DNA-binding transcriptional regulator [Candidatus Limnocylindrales bacterium]